MLVNNATFAHLGFEYELQKDLIAHPAQMLTLKRQPSTLSALFEAHVAAAYLSALKHGVSNNYPPSPPQSPGMARTASSSKQQGSRGEAYEFVASWLSQVFTPVARYCLIQLRKEEARLLRLEENADSVDAEGEIEESEESRIVREDEKAKGATMLLNQWATHNLGLMPTYNESGSTLGPHTCSCVVVDKEGKQR